MPKSTKVGINVYLSGYLKEENVRFRDAKIKFEAKPPIKKLNRNELTSWQDIEKKLGKFKLKAEQGTIYKHEVAGILGENGIGKTSFVRILAEDIKQDKGKITEKAKVSYKPQYLESNSKEIVVNVLRRAIQKYTNQLINPLQIKPLLMKKLNELSGGELQRVSIALCLSQDAKLYLLDEPSAYLDVEQRIIISKVIGDFMEHKGTTALVVDHDLLFIDYISQNIIVFNGKPAIEGFVNGPYAMEEGMNIFLKDLQITFRRDHESHRPRANKKGSVKDREQKETGKLYYG
jgi:ATP-binding cassette subfamily E protein 1